MIEIEDRPIMKVSVRRLQNGEMSFTNLSTKDQSHLVYSVDNFGLGQISHQVDFRLLDIPDFETSTAFTEIKKCPVIAGEIRQVRTDAMGDPNSIDEGRSISPELDIWAGRNDYLTDENGFPVSSKMIYVNPYIEDMTDPKYWEQFNVMWPPSLVWLGALEQLLKSEPKVIAPYLSHTLTIRVLKRWLRYYQEYLETRDVLLCNRTKLVEIYQTNIRLTASGQADTGKVVDRIAKFLKREAIEVPHCRFVGTRAASYLAQELVQIIQHERLHESREPRNDSDGLQFEFQILDELANMGFSVVPTKASGDFGADIIAEAHDLRFAIQCKNTARSVGIKAVQEAAASRKYYKCDFAVVVASANFTAAADELASENGTILLQAHQLSRLNEVLFAG